MKTPPKILFDSEVRSLAYFEEQLQGIEELGVKGVTFFIGLDYPHTKDSLDLFLQKIPVPVSGGLFPEVIYGDKYYADGMIAILWFDEIRVSTFLDASDLNSALYNEKNAISVDADTKASLVFSNTKTRATEAALDALHYRSGQRVQYAGAGSGSLTDLDGLSIVTNDGLVGDTLQITSFPYEQKTHVGHGWSVLSGPHLVTESEENRVKSLDYQPIKPYYQSLVRNNVGDEVKDLTFQQMMDIYPVGIQPYDESMVVRAIHSYTDGSMKFFGDIPDFSSVYILSGKQESLLDYIKTTADDFKTIANEKPDLSIVFSCCGRRYHMAEKSDEELSILAESLGESKQIIGVNSIGEVASNSTGMACFHSMTLVVANLWI